MPSERNVILSVFNAGELSPRVWRRLDFEKRRHGVRRLINLFPTAQGGVVRRPGTRFVAEVKHHDKYTRLVPFEFSAAVAYVVEMGEKYFRFYRDGGRIELPAYSTAIANGTFDTSLAGWTTTGDVVWVDDSAGPPSWNLPCGVSSAPAPLQETLDPPPPPLDPPPID